MSPSRGPQNTTSPPPTLPEDHVFQEVAPAPVKPDAPAGRSNDHRPSFAELQKEVI